MRTGTFKFGKKIPDNLTLVSLVEGTEIDVEYRPFEMKFVASSFSEDLLKLDFEPKIDRDDKNLKNEGATKKE